MDFEKLLRKYRKNVLFPEDNTKEAMPDWESVLFNKNDIEKIIPHRDPFLLLNSINSLDVENRYIVGAYDIQEDNPIFQGHFPGMPIYPGTLQVEMIGQLGLCLGYFVKNNINEIQDNAKPEDIRATKIIGAHFLNPVVPGKKTFSIAQVIDFDDIFGTVIGQVVSDDKICCVSIGEVYFVD